MKPEIDAPSIRTRIENAARTSNYKEVTKLINDSKTLILDLENFEIDDKFAAAIASGISNHRTFQKVLLNKSAISPKGLEILAGGLKNNNVITTLEIKNGRLGDNLATQISEVVAHEYSALSHVKLAGNNLTDQGAAVLATSLENNKKLGSLDLSFNQITDKGANLLKTSLEKNSNITLKKLDLSNNEVSQEVIKDINEILPEEKEERYKFSDFIEEPLSKTLERKNQEVERKNNEETELLLASLKTTVGSLKALALAGNNQKLMDTIKNTLQDELASLEKDSLEKTSVLLQGMKEFLNEVDEFLAEDKLFWEKFKAKNNISNTTQEEELDQNTISENIPQITPSPSPSAAISSSLSEKNSSEVKR